MNGNALEYIIEKRLYIMTFPTVIAISIERSNERHTAVRHLTRIGCDILADCNNRSDLHVYCYSIEQVEYALIYLKQ